MPYVSLQAEDGQAPLSLYYHHFAGPVGATPLLLLHELGGSVATWDAFAAHLARHFDVYAFDQRCAGASEKVVAPFTIWDLAADVVRFAEAVGIRGRFALIGLAMGAVTALHVAIRHGERLAALVLCDGTPGIDERSSAYLLDRATKVRSEGMRVVAEPSFKNAFRGLPEPEANPAWRDYKARFICNGPVPYAMQSEALARFTLTDADFARVQAPTLVLTGRNDFIWPPPTGAALADRLPGARFEIVEDAAHFPPLQKPQQVADTVTQFLAQQVR